MKTYAELITEKINTSGLSLNDVVFKCSQKGLKITTSYISKLKNGKMPPPSDDVSRVLAEVLEIDPEWLVITGYLERAPNEFKKVFKILGLALELFKNEK